MAKNAVPTNRLRNNAVSADKIAAGSVSATKLAGVIVRTNTASVSAESNGSTTAACVGNERMLSGGGGFNIITGAPHPWMVASFAENSNTWRVRVHNPAAFSRNLTVRVICLA